MEIKREREKRNNDLLNRIFILKTEIFGDYLLPKNWFISMLAKHIEWNKILVWH